MTTRRRRSCSMAVAALLAGDALAATATTIYFVNECAEQVQWYDGSLSRAIQAGEGFSTALEAGDNAAYRAGVTTDATLAEFAVDESNTWYDISIIPTGSLGGPGSCSSYEECKQVTGGEGFNVAMQIVPSRAALSSSAVCRTLSCFEAGCDDAYKYPDEAGKTHNCAIGISFEVIFCPANSSSSASSDWVPLNSSSASGSDETGEYVSGSSSAAQSVSKTTSGTISSASASGSEQQVENSNNSSSSSSTSAVVVATVLGALVVIVVVGTVVARHWRELVLKWESAHWHKPRVSSPTLSFVEVEDLATP